MTSAEQRTRKAVEARPGSVGVILVIEGIVDLDNYKANRVAERRKADREKVKERLNWVPGSLESCLSLLIAYPRMPFQSI
jgi:hypothetical protein